MCQGSDWRCSFSYGNISPYMISYLRNRTSEHTLSNVDSLWINNAAQVVTPFAVTIGGLIDRRLGVRIATATGCIIFCSGVALTYFTIKKSLVMVALSYGALANFGSFIAYGPPAQCAVKWFPKRPGFAAGLIVCGSGGGALIFNQVVTMYINPGNLSPDLETADGEKYFTDKDVLDRIPKVFLLLAGIYVCLQCIGILLLTTRPTDTELARRCQYNREKNEHDGNEEDSPLVDVTHKAIEKVQMKTVLYKMLTDKNAYIWWIILFNLYGGMTIANGLYKVYGQTFIADDHFIALIGSLSAVFNCVFRPVWGMMMDKYGFQVAVKLASACFVCLSCTIMHTETLGKVAFLLWICGMYGSSCCVMSIGPATLAELFGVEYMAINMGFTFSAVTAAALTVGFIGLDLQNILGWHGLFLLTGFMGATAFFVTFLFDGRDAEGNLI
ncbi:uncharacterized protein LOC123553875 isoform X2 [Mercenaria mercenaria]|uniref:uncharacterized protein LOC123553875 isoform X2 n=1 Tax=Mercenaria mercenaria TaxID=6596 RepID=UPI00234EF58A|nr:uncharacterized protein LOC123553875 isoform X2 [Mercenaria mercenaria]